MQTNNAFLCSCSKISVGVLLAQQLYTYPHMTHDVRKSKTSHTIYLLLSCCPTKVVPVYGTPEMYLDRQTHHPQHCKMGANTGQRLHWKLPCILVRYRHVFVKAVKHPQIFPILIWTLSLYFNFYSQNLGAVESQKWYCFSNSPWQRHQSLGHSETIASTDFHQCSWPRYVSLFFTINKKLTHNNRIINNTRSPLIWPLSNFQDESTA